MEDPVRTSSLERGSVDTRAQRSATRYNCLDRWQAFLVLVLVCLAVGGCLTVTRGDRPRLSGGNGEGDLALYSRVVQRLRGGEGYYDALGSELRRSDYPTGSVFNWRTPMHLELIARLPNFGWASTLLVGGGLCAIGLAVVAMIRGGHIGLALAQAVLMFIPLSVTVMSNTFLFGEVWAGMLIAVSVGSFALGWRRAGAVTGVLALFFRELALPYVLIGVFLAMHRRRRAELWIWLAGVACYAFGFGLHAMAVMSRIPASGLAPDVSRWVQFGGVRFVLITSRVGLLLGLPFSVAAVYLPLALLGLAGWVSPAAGRATATVLFYLLAFSVIGLPSANFYWGAIYTPLLAFGTVWSLPACRDLVMRLFSKRSTDLGPAASMHGIE
jgi:hypothetical protein